MKHRLFYRILGMLKKTGANWDKLAPTKDTAIDFAHTHINPEPVQMIDTYRYSWEYCLAHSGEMLNDRLRGDRLDDDDRSIMEMVSKHSCDTDLVLYRGVHDEIFSMMLDNAKGLDGVDLLEKGYLYCSLVKGHETHCRIRLRIFAPAGSTVVYSGNVNNEQGYYEAVVQHGAKLKLVSCDRDYINCLLLGTE